MPVFAAVTNAVAAFWMMVTLPAVIVPSLSYTELISGTQKVRPMNFLPERIVLVYHRTHTPVPAAYVTAPVAATVAAVPPDQDPERMPVSAVKESPLAGICQLTPEGKRALIALKNVPSDAVASSAAAL